MANRDQYRDECYRREQRANRSWSAWLGTYSSHFHEAIAIHKDTHDRQKAIDLAKAEALSLALSLAGGTALTAVLGKEAMKTTISEFAVRQARDRGVARVFRSAGISVDGSTVGDFIGGKVESTVYSKLQGVSKAGLESVINKPGSANTDDLGTFFRQFARINIAGQEVLKIADALHSSSQLTDDVAAASFDHLYNSAFMRGAPASVPNDTTQRIALTLFLTDVMDLDYYVIKSINPADIRQKVPAFAGIERISGSPKATDWRSQSSQTGSNSFQTKTARIDGMGRTVKRKIDELHEQVLGQSFFQGGFWEGRSVDRADLIKAEESLMQLAERLPVEVPPAISLRNLMLGTGG